MSDPRCSGRRGLARDRTPTQRAVSVAVRRRQIRLTTENFTSLSRYRCWRGVAWGCRVATVQPTTLTRPVAGRSGGRWKQIGIISANASQVQIFVWNLPQITASMGPSMTSDQRRSGGVRGSSD